MCSINYNYKSPTISSSHIINHHTMLFSCVVVYYSLKMFHAPNIANNSAFIFLLCPYIFLINNDA